MFIKTTIAAVIAATIVAAAPVLGSQSTSETTTKASNNIAAEGWITRSVQIADHQIIGRFSREPVASALWRRAFESVGLMLPTGNAEREATRLLNNFTSR